MTLPRRTAGALSLALLTAPVLGVLAVPAQAAAVPATHAKECAAEGIGGALTLVRKATDRGGMGTSRASFATYVYRGSDANRRCVVVDVRAAGNKQVKGHSSSMSVSVDLPGDAVAATGERYVGLAQRGEGSMSVSGGSGALAPVSSLRAYPVTLSEERTLEPELAPYLPIALKPLAEMVLTYSHASVEVSVGVEATTTRVAKPVRPAAAAKARAREVAAAKAVRAASVEAAVAERDALLAVAATQTGLLAEWTTFYATAGHVGAVQEAKGTYKAAVRLAKQRERLAVRGKQIVQLQDHEFAASLPLA